MAALAVSAATTFLFGGLAALPGFAILAGATLGLALLGGIDDIRPLPSGPRLLVQIAAVSVAIWAIDPGRLLPASLPLAVERVLMVLAGTWWVNLVNFMDGIDWMTAAEFVPLSAALALFGIAGWLPPGEAALAAALGGALVGFAPFNRPVARLFLGDVGSLPLGLLSGAVLLGLASAGHIAAALLLPLYYLADATITLGLRARRGERVWEAHRSHFYQRALGHGFTVTAVDAHVLGLNFLLAGLAALTILWPPAAWPALVLGAVAVAIVLRRFITPRSV